MRDFIFFPKGISLKVSLIARLEPELVYHNVTVQYVSHGDSPPRIIGYLQSFNCMQTNDYH